MTALRIPPRHTEENTRTKCHRPFRAAPEFQTGGECSYYDQHPEKAPGHWTWTRLAHNTWGIAAYRPDHDNPPTPGDQVTVHRQDGATSTETIAEVREPVYDTTARPIVRCTVA